MCYGAASITRRLGSGSAGILSADGTTGVLRDRYRDSTAVLELYGSPAPELLAALAALGPSVFGPLQSL